MKMLSKLNDSSVHSAIAGGIIFLLVANPFIFNLVDGIFSKLLGTAYGSNKYIVLVVHAIVFSVLMYFINKWILRHVFKSVL